MRYAFLFILLFASLTYAAAGDEGQTTGTLPSCSVKTSCNATEVCWFSLSNTTDAHVSDCVNDPYSYKLCCNERFPATVRTACNSNETDILTYSSSSGDAHLSDPYDPYSQHVCIQPAQGQTLQCSIKQTSQQTADEQCQITMSSQYDAHAAYCSDPYTYSLVCQAGVSSAYAPHVFTVSVKPNNQVNTVYIEGSGSRSSSALTTASYPSSYAISYQGRNIAAVASFRPQERDVIKTSKGAIDHEIALEQPVQRNKAFVILTRADVDQVQEILSSIDSPTDANTVSFGYATDPNMRVNVGIESNAVIDIQGNETMLPGTYRVEIKKIDSQNNVQFVRIRKE